MTSYQSIIRYQKCTIAPKLSKCQSPYISQWTLVQHSVMAPAIQRFTVQTLCPQNSKERKDIFRHNALQLQYSHPNGKSPTGRTHVPLQKIHGLE